MLLSSSVPRGMEGSLSTRASIGSPFYVSNRLIPFLKMIGYV